MQKDDFFLALESENAPSFDDDLLTALWFVFKGKWDRAHTIVQEDESEVASWMHGLIHKIEGDISNARYWYKKADRTFEQNISLEQERNEILNFLFSALK